MQRPTTIQTRHHRIQADGIPYLIAEIGLNHNGSLELALKMVESAAKAGASAVKFQIYRPEFFLSKAKEKDDPVFDLFQSLALSEADWYQLKKRADELGVDFLASVFDLPSLQLYASLGAEMVKIASGDLTNRLLIEQVVEMRLPILLSSGMANDEEVARAMSWIPAHIPVALLQCVSSYPADPADMNLRTLSRWRKVHTPLVGISDHTMGNEVSLGSIPLGGVVIERHFTLDRNMEGPDQSLSLEPEEFARLATESHRLYQALGGGDKITVPAEEGVRKGARRSLHWGRDLEVGHIIQALDLLPLRPGGGIDVADYRTLIGKEVVREVKTGQRIEREDFVTPVA